MKSFFVTVIFLFISSVAQAELKKEWIEYTQDDTVIEGYVVYDENLDGKRPGVMVVHDWMGFGEYPRMRADQLAELGYVALAADIYGKGVRPQNFDEASQQAGFFKKNRGLLRERAKAGLEELKNHPLVDAERVAAIGYCFGGTAVLELARSGAQLNGVVSFHGGLDTPTPEDAKNIKARILVLHGADDPFVPAAEVEAFQNEMRQNNVDWQMIFYSGAVHSFTQKSAGDDNTNGAAYHEKADKRSWKAMQQFLKEIFKE